jgi:hypothetical protein
MGARADRAATQTPPSDTPSPEQLSLDLTTQGMAEAAYRDDKFEPELCHHCGVSYRGPALYCSLTCAIADA